MRGVKEGLEKVAGSWSEGSACRDEVGVQATWHRWERGRRAEAAEPCSGWSPEWY